MKLILCAAGMLLTASRVRAEERFVVVPFTSERLSNRPLINAAQAIDAELDSRGIKHLPLGQAPRLFSERHSRHPVALSAEAMERLAQEGKMATRLIDEQPAKALEHLDVAWAPAQAGLENVNRDERAARYLFSVCLLQVRGLLRTKSPREQVIDKASECLHVSPGATVDEKDHPKDVVLAMKQAERLRGADVLVESQPAGCDVIGDGIKLGVTPFKIRRPYLKRTLVEVQCGERGRVHSVEAGDNEVNLVVDVTFERALRTNQPILELRYDHIDLRDVDKDAQQVRQVLETSDIIAVVGIDDRKLMLRRIGAQATREVGLSDPFTASQLTAALDDLLREPRSREVVVAPPSQVQVEPPHLQLRQHPIEKKFVVAGTVLSPGLLGAGWFLYLANASKTAARPDAIMILALAGGGLGTVSNSLGWYPRDAVRNVPWWAWTLGSIGLASVAVGAWRFASDDECLRSDGTRCPAAFNTRGHVLGTLLMSTGASLVTLPIGFARLHAQFEASPAGLTQPAQPKQAAFKILGRF